MTDIQMGDGFGLYLPYLLYIVRYIGGFPGLYVPYANAISPQISIFGA